MIISIGLDVAKEKIDFYSNGVHAQFDNEPKSIKNHFKSLDKNSVVVMEATGKFHRLAHKILVKMGFKVIVINPYQSRYFAKSLNIICKTDKVDAKVLAMFGGCIPHKPTSCPTDEEQNMQDLSRHLDDLKNERKKIFVRIKESKGFIKNSLDKVIKSIDKEIKATEKKLTSIVKANTELSEKAELLMSIPGLGETTAITLLSLLKELGSVNKNEIAALTGLAPINNESGKFNGQRRIKGGRRDVRSHLYMPIIGAATQHNEQLKIFYDRLVKSGKPKKVALTACMRKLVIWANALLRTGEYWNENYTKTC